MAFSASDRRLVVLTGGAVVLAALFFGGVLVLATNSDPGPRKPVFLGLEDQKRKDIRADGPQYVSNPFGGNGFWLDLEKGKLVALDVDAPGRGYCEVKWKRTTYIDCHGDSVTTLDLNRFKVIIGSLEGSPPDSVFVDLRKRSPAPALAATTPTSAPTG